MIDVARARAETPGCAATVHFNNAGAALMPDVVLQTLQAHVYREAYLGGYEAAALQSEALEAVYESIARLLNCAPHEVACVENATQAWHMAFYSLSFAPGDRILMSHVEYASNMIPFVQVARRTGALVEVIPADEYGQVSVAALREMLDERVRLIAITHVPTNGGLVNPAAEIGAVAREAGIPYLLDACQSVGQMPIDVQAIGCDFLSATGRKFLRGPRGSGFLYVREQLLEQIEPPFLDLHAATLVAPDRYVLRADARRFENWESNIAAKLALGAAVEYALGWSLEAIYERAVLLAESLREKLGQIPGIQCHDQGLQQCAITTFTVNGVAPEAVKAALAQQRINVSISDRTSTFVDMQARDLAQLIRASVHYYNTENEIQYVADTLAQLIKS